MRFPLLGKLCALGGVMLVLMAALSSVGSVVSERQSRQREAERSVELSLATQQTLLGPLLQRHCSEQWDRAEDDGKAAKKITERRDFVLTAWPRRLDAQSEVAIEPRYRGIFKVNGYLLKATLAADWSDLDALRPRPDHAGSRLQCDAPLLALALSDARGIRAVQIKVGGQSLPAAPGSTLAGSGRGLHAVLADTPALYAAPLRADVVLEVAGTRSVGWVPIGDETTVRVASNWPHPSFAGSFLPVERQVGPHGFRADWKLSALATSAQADYLRGASLCEAADTEPYAPAVTANRGDAKCVESFGVGFVDPVSGYVLSDRAVKYGILFIVLTFVGVMLVEVLRRVRVHPVQYLLVGCALTVFFLLLLSLGEHLSFPAAYLAASSACTLLLAYYGGHVLHGVRAGLLFGAATALLYAALYALLQMEQSALVLGSLLLFAVLTAVMVATRRIDWYALATRMREDAAPRAGRRVPEAAGT
ncbi:MAG: cell envelope integrity protein CreD [Proteobacteria bacterium]|nr:cell envelope integrity protein CreD [Pseudomonadota bacterium]